MNDVTKIAIAGLGTVGVGVVKMLHAKSAELGAKLGKKVALVGVCARSSKDRGVDLSGVEFFTDAQEMIRTCAPDIFVELIGGSEGPALEAVTHALQSGIHVVTANKALIAVHGAELARLAETSGAGLRFEAAVAGGIPIIKALQEGLIGNQVIRVAGILNGTCNYILSAMDKTGDEFQVMLGKAQALGYAEADPTFDVDGIDAAHKIAILASCAFGTIPRFDQVDIEGIRGVTSDDINYARELGYRLKLLGIARRNPAGLEQRVHLAMVPEHEPLANVDGVFNAVMLDAEPVGRIMIDGRGAGEGPTASAVVADIADIIRGMNGPSFGRPVQDLEDVDSAPSDERMGAYYIRLSVKDEPGVLAAITHELAHKSVSLDIVLQKARDPGANVPLILVTHDTREGNLREALGAIAKQPSVAETPVVIRIFQS